VATCVATDPQDVYNIFSEAKQIRGPKFIHILSPCAPGWRYPASRTTEMGDLAVKTGIFLLWKQIDGELIVNKRTKKYLDKKKRLPLKEYLKEQGRFAELTDYQIEDLQAWVDKRCEKLARFV
ncbi:MAG: pyruvate synthase subunit beta, partial [Deltaproteobacteria bacterium]|nr:pyruvate synthase subunit beta [Deltaproteobacteria bacterium]